MSESDLEEQNECDSSPIRNSIHHQQIEARFLFPQPWKCNHVPKNPERKLDCFDRSKVWPCNYATSKKLNKAAQRICKTCINECICADYDPNAKKDLVEEKSPEEEEEDEESSEEEEEEEAEEEVVEIKEVAKIKVAREKRKVDDKAPEVLKSDGDDGKKKDDEKKEEKKGDDDGKKKVVDDGKKKVIQDKKKKGGDDAKKKVSDDGKKKGDGEMAGADKLCKTPCVLEGAVKRKSKIPCSEAMTKPCLGTCSKIPDSECVSAAKRSRIPVKLNCNPNCKTEREGQTKKPQCAAKAKSRKCSSCGAGQSSQPTNKKTANDCKNCKSTKYVVQRALLEIPLSYYWLKSNKLRTIDLAKFNIAPDLLEKFGLQLIKFRSKDPTKSFKNKFRNSDNKSGASEIYSSSVLPMSLITQDHMRCPRNLHGMASPILMVAKDEKCTHGTKPKIPCEGKEESDDIRINLFNPYTWLTGDEFCKPDDYDNTSNLKTCWGTSSHDSENSEYEISDTDSYCPSSEVTWSMMMGRGNETRNISITELSSHQVMGEEKQEIEKINGLRPKPEGSEHVAKEREIQK